MANCGEFNSSRGLADTTGPGVVEGLSLPAPSGSRSLDPKLAIFRLPISRYGRFQLSVPGEETFKRFVERRAHEALSDTPVVLIVGPRRAGKTTLVRRMGEARRTYITLDDQTVLEQADRPRTTAVSTQGRSLTAFIRPRAQARPDSSGSRGDRSLDDRTASGAIVAGNWAAGRSKEGHLVWALLRRTIRYG